MAVRPILRIGVTLIAVAAAVACGGSPASPRAGALRIVADPIVTIEDGQSMALRVEDAGRVQDPSQYQWATSDATIVGVSSDGVVRSAGGYGEAIVTAASPVGSTASVRIWVQYPESRPSTYRITFVFADDIHPEWREAYAWAGERWAQVIRTDLPPVDLTGQTACRFPPGIAPI